MHVVLGQLTGRAVDERLPATIAANVTAFERGASVFRVHEVAPVRDALAVAQRTMARLAAVDHGVRCW